MRDEYAVAIARASSPGSVAEAHARDRPAVREAARTEVALDKRIAAMLGVFSRLCP
jgi:hypothetical protein